jgi:hypothetical protein
LIGVIVGLAIASAIWFSLIRTALIERRVVRHQQATAQARELAWSAMERAAARLAADDGYEGETWSIPAAALGAAQAAEVKIEVSPHDTLPERRQIRIQARYGDSIEHRSSETLEASIDLSSERNDS